MLRSVLALLAGFGVAGGVTWLMSPAVPIAFLRFTSGGEVRPVTDPSEFSLLLAAHSAGVLLGGFVSAAVAGRSPLRHAFGFAVILMVAMLAGLPEAPEQPIWWLAASFLLCPPVALAGGWLAKPRAATASS